MIFDADIEKAAGEAISDGVIGAEEEGDERASFAHQLKKAIDLP